MDSFKKNNKKEKLVLLMAKFHERQKGVKDKSLLNLFLSWSVNILSTLSFFLQFL